MVGPSRCSRPPVHLRDTHCYLLFDSVTECQQHDRSEDQKRNQHREDRLWCDEQQCGTRHAAKRRDGQDDPQAPSLARQIGPLGDGAAEIAWYERDRVGDIRRNWWYPERKQDGE